RTSGCPQSLELSHLPKKVQQLVGAVLQDLGVQGQRLLGCGESAYLGSNMGSCQAEMKAASATKQLRRVMGGRDIALQISEHLCGQLRHLLAEIVACKAVRKTQWKNSETPGGENSPKLRVGKTPKNFSFIGLVTPFWGMGLLTRLDKQKGVLESLVNNWDNPNFIKASIWNSEDWWRLRSAPLSSPTLSAGLSGKGVKGKGADLLEAKVCAIFAILTGVAALVSQGVHAFSARHRLDKLCTVMASGFQVTAGVFGGGVVSGIMGGCLTNKMASKPAVPPGRQLHPHGAGQHPVLRLRPYEGTRYAEMPQDPFPTSTQHRAAPAVQPGRVHRLMMAAEAAPSPAAAAASKSDGGGGRRAATWRSDRQRGESGGGGSGGGGVPGDFREHPSGRQTGCSPLQQPALRHSQVHRLRQRWPRQPSPSWLTRLTRAADERAGRPPAGRRRASSSANGAPRPRLPWRLRPDSSPCPPGMETT
uniref:H(+)-exporting diphosphatase n=1 Tax=Macrostomum lignano TaxID=282301 RepID=A0A1I8JRM2_9PLAT